METNFSGFGDLLKTWRKRRGQTQKKLATLMGVHRNTIGAWELGSFLPESKTIVLELAHQLRLDTDETRRLLEASLTALSPYWYVPYQRNPFFTGREEVLQCLHEALVQEHSAILSQSYALSGLGGIGKTQTAIEYAYRYADNYSGIFWISAETIETIVSSMVAIVDILGVPEKQEKEQEKIINAVMRWLNNHKDWLLIFDNIEDLTPIKRFLPTTRSGSLLFTSRRHSLGLIAQTLTLERITPEEGSRFLTHRARILQAHDTLDQLSSTDIELVHDIVTAMDGLPLALDQAGAYIETTQCSLSTYLNLFQSSQVRLLDERDTDDNHPLSVTKTFTLAFDQLEKSNPAAAEMLTVYAYLAPEEIPEMFFIQGASSLESSFENFVADPLTFHAAIKDLLTYSLIQRNTARETISIHRLVQAVIKANIAKTMQDTWMARVLHTLAKIFPAHEGRQADYWQIGEKLLPHALLCIKFIEPLEEDTALQIPLMTLVTHVANYLSNRGRYIESDKLFQKALNIGKQQTVSDNFSLGETLHMLANHNRRQGKYGQAEHTFKHALQIREQVLGFEHQEVASTLDSLANLYVNQGRYKEAEPLYHQAIHITEIILGPDHLNIASPLNNLAILYHEQGRYDEEEPLYQRALAIWEQTFGLEHPRVAHALHNLANLYRDQGKYTQAEQLYQRVLSIREQTFGPEHFSVSYPLTNLATLYQEQGKYQQAESLYHRALQIRQQDLKSDHPLLGNPTIGLARVAFSKKKYKESEQLYQRALQIWEQALGPNNANVAGPLTGLGTLAAQQGRYEEAEALFQRALTLRQQRLSLKHPEVAETLHDFAHFRWIQHQIPEALSLYKQALTIREQALGSDHPHTRATRTNYETLLKEIGCVDDIAQRSLSPDLIIQTSTMSKQADTTVEQSRDEYPVCPTCQHNNAVVQSGVNRNGTQRFRCRSCQRYFTPGAKQRGYDAAIKAQAQALTQAGVSTREIAQRLNVHHSTVSLWTKEEQNQNKQ